MRLFPRDARSTVAAEGLTARNRREVLKGNDSVPHVAALLYAQTYNLLCKQR